MSTDTDDVDDPQRTLQEFATDEPGRCQAIAEYTSERCQQRALLGTDYCPDHFPKRHE